MRKRKKRNNRNPKKSLKNKKRSKMKKDQNMKDLSLNPLYQSSKWERKLQPKSSISSSAEELNSSSMIPLMLNRMRFLNL